MPPCTTFTVRNLFFADKLRIEETLYSVHGHAMTALRGPRAALSAGRVRVRVRGRLRRQVEGRWQWTFLNEETEETGGKDRFMAAGEMRCQREQRRLSD